MAPPLTFFLAATAFLFFASTSGAPENHQFKTIKPTAFHKASPNKAASNSFSLTKKKSARGYNTRSASHLLGHSLRAGHNIGLISLFEGEEFATEITFGTETFEVIVDTGSSDTWMVATNFSCVDINTSAPLPEADCGFGITYNVSDTFVRIPDENFNITYGDGEFLSGYLGWEEVTLAGITINQTVPIVDFAAWAGDGETSGLLGLSYEAITRAFSGNDPTVDSNETSIKYTPIFETMYTTHQIPPIFSLAISRATSGPAGYLSLGGLPPVSYNPVFTSTPILITRIGKYPVAYDFYTINISAAVLNNVSLPSSGGNEIQYIVDSGTTLNYFPSPVAASINAAYNPPATYDADYGVYFVDCNATAPHFAVRINGTDFVTDPREMILSYHNEDDGSIISCISGIDDGGEADGMNVFILGDTFLKGVVAVFDVGAVEMRFADRGAY